MKDGKKSEGTKAASQTQERRGRPPAHPNEHPTKVTVVMFRRQVAFLDHLAADVREKVGASLQRAEVIRALVDALSQSGLDLTAVDLSHPQEREENLRLLFLKKLRAR